MNFKQCCWCVVDILCLTFDPHNDWAHSSLFLAAAEKASWRKYMIRLHAWYRVVFPSCCTGYAILLWPKSSHIFISGQIQPWSNFATRYEAAFKHILVVWPNCLIISRIRIFSNSHTLLLSRSLLLSFHKLNLILPTGHNNVITVLWLIHWLWWTTWCLVVYSVFLSFTAGCMSYTVPTTSDGLGPGQICSLSQAPVGFEEMKSGATLVVAFHFAWNWTVLMLYNYECVRTDMLSDRRLESVAGWGQWVIFPDLASRAIQCSDDVGCAMGTVPSW